MKTTAGATLTLVADGLRETVTVPASGSLMQAIHTLERSIPHACNGKGTCGKCRVRVSMGESHLYQDSSDNGVHLDEMKIPAPSGKERQLLGDKALASGIRLACLIPVMDGMIVTLQEGAGHAKIAVHAAAGKPAMIRHPLFTQKIVHLPAPSLKDQRSMLRRFTDAAGPVLDAALPHMLASLPRRMKLMTRMKPLADGNAVAAGHPGPAGSDWVATCFGRFVLDAVPLGPEAVIDSFMAVTDASTEMAAPSTTVSHARRGIDGSCALTGLAVDIGTTTVVAYLCDLQTGHTLAAAARLNAQKRHGADVISRIQHAMEEEKGLPELKRLIQADIRALVAELHAENVCGIVITGNTTMLHLLAGLDPTAIATAPFIPVTTDTLILSGAEFGLSPDRFTPALLLPGLAAYVGADTLSAVLATGMHRSSQVSLLVDLGTNGEIALGSRERIFSCATAAGPAFEGAGIRNGMGAVEGAIDRVRIEDGKLSLSVLGHRKARGICGTGLVDAIAALLGCGIIEETGRLVFPDEVPDGLSEDLLSRLVETDDGKTEFILVHANQAHDGMEIVLTQRDVREFQNAKAAVCAGIRVLMSHAGIRAEEIRHVWLAGGFGNWMDAESALATGIIPAELSGRIVPVGNAAGLGAQMCLRDARHLAAQKKLARTMEYVELSGSRAFNDAYVEAMMFGEA